MERILVNGERFVDETGRERIFHGVNLVKDKLTGSVANWSRRDFEKIRRMGFNAVRLGFFWEKVEPQAGKFDDAYLDRMEGFLDLCAEYGVYAMLDMHQDLYAARYSYGAPGWATLTDGLPEPEAGEVWSDAYLSSEAIQRAFDHFWANDPAPDGMGLQDHFALCWQRIARRFGNRPEVLGYDFFNEPFPGSAMLPILGALLSSFAGLEAAALGCEPRTTEETAALFADKQSMFEALQLMDDPRRYAAFTEAVGALSATFDIHALAPFYARMATAIREVTPHGILMMENNYSGNLGVPSGAQPITAGGAREPLQAYAPHGYDLVVDTPLVGAGASTARAGVIFVNHRKTQRRLGVPALVGEWGAFCGYEDIAEHCTFLLDTFDQNLWSYTYWHWDSGETAAEKLLVRPYPMAVSGRLKSFHYNAASGALTAEWDNDPLCTAPTVVYLPEKTDGREVKLSPACDWEPVTENGATHLIIRSAQSGQHSLVVK